MYAMYLLSTKLHSQLLYFCLIYSYVVSVFIRVKLEIKPMDLNIVTMRSIHELHQKSSFIFNL